MLKKIKFNYCHGKLWQLRLFDIPIFQYTKEKNNKKSIKFPFLSKQKKKPLMFYLKYNSPNFHSLWCLHKWIETIRFMGGDYVIVCDNPTLEYKIIKNTIFDTKENKFIKSDRKTFKSIINNICDTTWINAGYSHLTTFSNAKKLGMEEFWNIDVDDTTFFDTPQNIARALEKVMEYSKKNNIDVFSLDMHASRFYNKHWSFGVSYTRNNSKLFNIIKNTTTRKWREDFEELKPLFGEFNLDWYFTYLRNNKIVNAQTYNIDNLYFAHWGFATPNALTRIIQIEEDGKLCFPFAYDLDMAENMKTILIKENIVRIDAQINKIQSLENCRNVLASYENKIKEHTDK